MSYSSRKPSKLQYLIYPGLILLIAGSCIFFLWPNLTRYIMNSNLTLKPDSQMFTAWQKTADPPYMEVYLFNWTNAEDGHNDEIKPKFLEIGPFRFLEVKEKVNITFNNENNTISYRQKRTWYFDEENSCCDLSTNVTIVNPILVTLSHKAKDWSAIVKSSLNLALRAFSPYLYVTKNVSQLLFEGYVDQLLAMGKSLQLPSLPPYDRFGMFYGKNGSEMADGLFNMGVSGANRGSMKRWNNYIETPYYPKECAQVIGSSGELYPSGLQRDQLSFFSPDMCRNIKLDYKEDVSIHGLTGYKYIAHHSMLDNGTLIPENSCYCNGDCMPSGILNISACKLGSPSFASLPHFLHADPVYNKRIEGLRPDKDKHQMFMVIEPNTGIPLQAAIRVQSNLHLKPIMYMTLINDVPDVIYPLVWFQVQIMSSPEVASGIKLLLKLPTILKSVAAVLIIIGIILICISLYIKKKRVDEKCSIREHVPLQSPKTVY